MRLRGYWLSSWNFFMVGKIYYYANPFCYVIVFGPNFKEGKITSGGAPFGRMPGYCCPEDVLNYAHFFFIF